MAVPLLVAHRARLAQVSGEALSSVWLCHDWHMAAFSPPSSSQVLVCRSPFHLAVASASQSQCLFCGASVLWIVLSEVKELQKQPKSLRWRKVGGGSVHYAPRTWEEPRQWDSAISELLFECPPCVRQRHRPPCRGDMRSPGRIASPLYMMLRGLGSWGAALVLCPGQDRAGLGPFSQQS